MQAQNKKPCSMFAHSENIQTARCYLIYKLIDFEDLDFRVQEKNAFLGSQRKLLLPCVSILDVSLIPNDCVSCCDPGRTISCLHAYNFPNKRIGSRNEPLRALGSIWEMSWTWGNSSTNARQALVYASLSAKRRHMTPTHQSGNFLHESGRPWWLHFTIYVRHHIDNTLQISVHLRDPGSDDMTVPTCIGRHEQFLRVNPDNVKWGKSHDRRQSRQRCERGNW